MLYLKITFPSSWSGVVVLGIVATLLLFGCAGFWCLWNGVRSNNWPSVPGLILESDMDISETKDMEFGTASVSASFKPRFRYKYVVDGRELVGTRVYFGQSLTGATSADAVIRLTMRFPVGKNVPVYVHERHPKRSVLMPGTSAPAWFTMVLGLCTLLAVLIFVLRTTASHVH